MPLFTHEGDLKEFRVFVERALLNVEVDAESLGAFHLLYASFRKSQNDFQKGLRQGPRLNVRGSTKYQFGSLEVGQGYIEPYCTGKDGRPTFESFRAAVYRHQRNTGKQFHIGDGVGLEGFRITRIR